jgi:FG-GAP-like repeat
LWAMLLRLALADSFKEATRLTFRRRSTYFVLVCSVCTMGRAQQFRQGQPDRAELSKHAIERHLQSKHPQIPADSSKPIPGKYLLGRESARSSQLQSRIRATSKPDSRVQAAAPSVLPGIQFRGALPAGAIANSVVTGDFNKDGRMDFVIANGGTNDLWIYLGNGDGTFQLPQIIPLTKGLTPVYLVTADLRGIGVLDLIVAEFDTSTVGVLLGNGDGTFGYEQDYVLPQPPGTLVIDDFNRDGKLDIAAVMVTVNNPTTTGVQYLATLLGDATGAFGAPLISLNPGFYSTADSIASGDVNNDGLPDVLITGPGLENSQVYLNAGDGTFTPGAVVAESGPINSVQAGVLADVNGDGCLDALVADANGYVWISLGDCGGNFGALTYVPMGDSNATVSVADMNGDGYPDIITATFPALDGAGLGDVAGNMLCVAFGDGKGNFSSGIDYVGTGMSYSLSIADFNGDGHPDVVSASPDTDTATVYINGGSGGFGFPQGEWIGLPGVGVLNAPLSAPSLVDVNGDGSPDVVLLDEGYNGEYFITTMLNDGTGRFASPVPSDAGVSITSNWMGDYCLGNFRNTGHLDFVGIGLGLNFSTGTQYIVFVPGNGDGTFGKPSFVSMPGASGEMGVGDFNGDGKLDFVTVGVNPNGGGWILTTFLGNGDGTFRNGGSVAFADSAELIARVFVGDFNRDGKLDVLIYDTGNGYWTTASYVWEFLGNGNGTFQPGQQLFSAFQPMTMADVNGDSWLDIVRYDFMWPDGTTETLGPPRFTTFLDQPSGTFAKSSSYTPYAGIPLQAEPFAQFGDPMTSSMVADMNGDGKLDEIAFQEPAPAGGDVYAEILMGNGDGTFTPTYDVFDFQKIDGFPSHAHILDGTTYSDLLEVDGATSSMHVFKGGQAPALQLALEEAQVTGNSGCGWIFLNLPSSSDTSVALSSSVTGVVLPPTVTVSAGALSQQFCYTLGSTYNWHQVFNIQAQLGTSTAVAYASQSYVVGFSESISSSAGQIIYPTQSTTPITVSLTSSQGYTSTVQLSCQGLPAGAACVFGSNTLAVSPAAVASTTLVINTTASTLGSGPVVIVASDANVTTRQSFNLTVVQLIVDPVGSPTLATSPGTGTAGIVIVGIPPYTPSCSGLPARTTCTFSGNLDAQGDDDISVAINVPSGISAGAYPFTIGVMSGPATASVGMTLNVTDFSLEPPNASSDWAPPGGAMTIFLSVLPINGFNGNVNLTCSLDVGGTCTGGSFLIGGTSPITINLPISVPSSASAGTHTLTVSATSGPLTHTAAFPFYIADYGGSLSKSTLTMTQGASGSLTAIVTASAGFAGTVSFSCSGSTQLTCSFSPSTVQPTTTNPQTTNITVTAGYSAFMLSPKESTKGRFLLLGITLPFGIVLGMVGARRTLAVRAAIQLFLLGLILTSLSCGEGSGTGVGGGGGGGGSNMYAVTVNANVAGTNTTKTLGTISVTVTH